MGRSTLYALIVLLLAACTLVPVVPAARTATPSLALPTSSSVPDLQPPTPGPLSLTPRSPVRPAVVAGTWYPAEPKVLADLIDGLLAATTPVDGQPIGLIVPHAGYSFSGATAAVGFEQLAGQAYDVAVIIAADHQLPVSTPISIWAEGGFETPLGVVPVDTELAAALTAADDRIQFNPATHAGEHPIEIELPFLQRVCPNCRIVPILMGADDDETIDGLAAALLATLPGRRAVVIASSDLSHYPSQADALRVDGATLAAIETGDPAALHAATTTSMAAGIPNLATCACGEGPIRVIMRVAAGLGANTTSLLHYATSADSPQGNAAQVVGYAAVMLWRYEPPDLTQARQEKLLTLARSAIIDYLDSHQLPAEETDDPVLARRAGAFVTLRLPDGSLRGCIGSLQASKPLYQTIREMAVAAATSDPRFPVLTAEELNKVQLEISVLSPLHRLTDPQQVRLGTDGLLIIKDGRKGVFLPQVAPEQGWTRAELLNNLCLKAGLLEKCWQDRADLYTFTAIVFGEKE